MNDPDSAPSPKRFCRRLGMRNAALNASADSETCPKYFAISLTRTSPTRRLAKMPAATIVSGRTIPASRESWVLTPTRRRFGPGDPLVGVRGLPREPRHHDGVLLQIFLGDALVQVHVRVVHADVVVL